MTDATQLGYSVDTALSALDRQQFSNNLPLLAPNYYLVGFIVEAALWALDRRQFYNNLP